LTTDAETSRISAAVSTLYRPRVIRTSRLLAVAALTVSLRACSGGDMRAITTADCPGEQRPPVTGAILRLLAGATPVEVAP
jgi:hypothetical protein